MVIDCCYTLEHIDLSIYLHRSLVFDFRSTASEQLQFGLVVATACSCRCSCKFVAQFVWTCGTHKLCWSFVDGLPPPCAATFGGHKKSWSRCQVAQVVERNIVGPCERGLTTFRVCLWLWALSGCQSALISLSIIDYRAKARLFADFTTIISTCLADFMDFCTGQARLARAHSWILVWICN